MATTAAENPNQTLAQPHHEPQQSAHNATAETDDPLSPATLSTPEQPSLPDSSGGENSKNTAVGVAAVNASSSSDGGTESNVQKKIKRAERFGMSVQLSEEEKRNSRAERFGTGPAVLGSDAPKSSEEHKRKARAERFGLAQSASADEEAKKKSRLERFGQVSKNEPLEEEKKKARAIRFSQSKPTSVSQMNGGGTVESEASNIEKTGGDV